MAPRTKRPRSNSSSQAETSSNKTPRTNPKPTPHDALWFDDGSIVLATDVHLYRIHKGDFPTSGEGRECADDAEAEEWDGVPFVKMVGDSDENVCHLLMMLYDCDFYDVLKPTTLPIISSLLLMSTKYDIPSVRTQVIKRLENYYPNDIAKAFETPAEVLFDDDVPDDCDFQLLAVAHRCNVRRILPMLYYKCAIRDLQFILKSSDDLEKEVLHKILVGRERLLRLSYDFGVLLLFPSGKCDSNACSDMRRVMIELYTKTASNGQPPQSFPIEAVSSDLMGMDYDQKFCAACDRCARRSTGVREEFKKNFWDDLPNIFGLDTWNEVLNRN
ncbi:hypothetical protein SCHPADRAFT_1002110 [Schizopora paradoxa]|uniref:BTB domain-containing protein n=1 Tax=Schizopora paradoxa TaxID=27342 RepID=A0A0H2RPR8_9AGAM|nr:hypothetical protein SCHPADRAFT_1002110 [Schizopora paradoxa]